MAKATKTIKAKIHNPNKGKEEVLESTIGPFLTQNSCQKFPPKIGVGKLDTFRWSFKALWILG